MNEKEGHVVYKRVKGWDRRVKKKEERKKVHVMEV